VRLQVIPNDADDPSKRTIIDITRDEVKLKDQEAKAELLDVTGQDGKVSRIGWITLPSFYANMSGDGEPKSTTADVDALLTRLKKENIEGLVIDLRRDGGGSLEEAINLTGLFIPQGPVVQAKDPSGKITVNNDKNPDVSYSGPMIVLMNRLSASASEIFAAALQDYGRALIVGDERSFGKGTVQTIVDLDKSMSLPFFNVQKPEGRRAEAHDSKILPHSWWLDPDQGRGIRYRSSIPHGQCRNRRGIAEESVGLRRGRTCGVAPERQIGGRAHVSGRAARTLEETHSERSRVRLCE
jgi:carboxyl-terminal processing protease